VNVLYMMGRRGKIFRASHCLPQLHRPLFLAVSVATTLIWTHMHSPITLNGPSAVKFATWNIRSLAAPLQQECLVRDLTRCGISIACLQETRLRGPAGRPLDNSHIVDSHDQVFELLHSDCEEGGHHGVGIAYRSGLEVLDVEYISPPLMRARSSSSAVLKMRCRNFHLRSSTRVEHGLTAVRR
jgi:hypothetical protein